MKAASRRRRRLRSAAGTPTRSGRARPHPELVDRKLADVAAERGADAARLPARPRARRARPRAAGAHDHRQRRRGRRRRSARRRALHARAVRRRRARRASCATRRRPPTSSATGCATRASCRWSRPSASSAACRPTSSASTTAATCVRARAPTSWCSTRRPSRPVRCVGSATSRPNAERLTADAPVGMQHVVVNGTPIRVDGDATDAGTVGQVVRPSARP